MRSLAGVLGFFEARRFGVLNGGSGINPGLRDSRPTALEHMLNRSGAGLLVIPRLANVQLSSARIWLSSEDIRRYYSTYLQHV